MAEKKVLSLNERHNRFLSASQPRKPSNHVPLTEEGMADVTEDGKAVKTKLVGRRRLCKISRDSDDDDVPQFSGFSDFDSPSEDENVEIEGRRRLFKLSSNSDDQNDNDKDNSAPEEPSFSVLSDFDSPLAANELIERDSGGRNEVRDILDEPKFSILSDVDSPSPAKKLNESSGGGGIGSRDLLDEQKFSTPDSDSPSPAKKMIESDNGSGNGGGDLQSPGEPEFSVPPVSDSSSLAKKFSESDAGGGNGSSDLLDEQKISNFDSPPPANDLSGSDAGGGNEIRDILNDLSSKLEFLSIEKKRVPKTYDLIEDSSDVIANEVKNEVKNTDMFKCTSATSPISLLSVPSDTSSDVSTWSRVGGSLQTLVDTYADEEDVLSELEGDNLVEVNKNKPFAGRQMTNEPNRGNGKLEFTGQSFGVNKTKTFDGSQMKSELKRSNVKLDLPKQSFVLNLQEEVDDDDCVVLSNAKSSKETEKQGSKSKEELNGVGGVDEVSEWENCITLSGPNSTYLLPGKIAKMLYPHQRDGLRWLWSLHCQGKGGILGDDMGLGKTMQICGFLAGLFSSRLIKRALIVAPKTLLPHWIKELSVVGLSEKTREYFATSAKLRQYELDSVLQNNGVLLTTYDIVRNNSKALSGISYYLGERSEDSITWDYMILDEGHLIKNPSTQRAKSLLEVPSAHRIIISGTPIQNNLKELWALFNFCCPELLGDKAWFKEKYESPILRGNDKNASDREKRIGSTVAKEFRERIQPYFLRRLKNEVFCDSDDTNTAKLSKKSEIIVWLRLTSCQRQLYEAFLKSELVLSAFDGSPLAALTILKKICDHPLLLTKRAAEDLLDGMDSMLNPEDLGVAEKLAMHIAEEVTETDDFQDKHDNVSCKISFILALLNNLIPEGHKVLIFSQTRKMLNLIQESLLSKGYRFLRIDGTTKAVDRLKIVNDFQEGVGAPIFLLTSQVGGLGLTLTKADRVIVVDPAWNPSTDNQSVDRAYRIGQRKDVIVYRLMTCGTVEEKIYRKQVFKGGLFKTATEHKEQIRYFSQQDLRELFSLPKAGFDVSPTQQQLHEEHDSQYTMEEYLKAHIKFLETQGIAGVSHHSLLFSKTPPAPPEQVEEEVKSIKRNAIYGKSSSHPPLERDVDGSEYAFNPKDVKPSRRDSSMNIPGKPTEQELRERIDRLSSIFANKVTVSKLPDKGEKIQKQIVELNSELDKMKMGKKVEKEVYEYVDINGELQKVFNV